MDPGMGGMGVWEDTDSIRLRCHWNLQVAAQHNACVMHAITYVGSHNYSSRNADMRTWWRGGSSSSCYVVAVDGIVAANR